MLVDNITINDPSDGPITWIVGSNDVKQILIKTLNYVSMVKIFIKMKDNSLITVYHQGNFTAMKTDG